MRGKAFEDGYQREGVYYDDLHYNYRDPSVQQEHPNKHHHIDGYF
jgi:hypothetical protein